MDDAVMAFVCEEMLADPAVRAAGLAQRIRARFGIPVHPRTIERALRRHEKKLYKPEARQAFESHTDKERVLADLYERLREQVPRGFGGRGGIAGPGLLMTQGMGAWMLRYREFTPVAAGAGCLDSLAAPIPPVEFETQVAEMIAGMVLNRSRRELPSAP